MINPKEFSITDYLNKIYSCNCDKEHSTDLKEVEISEGAITKIPSIVKKYGYKKIFIVSDCNTYKVAGESVQDVLIENDFEVVNFIFSEEEVIPNERTLGEIFAAYDRDCDLIIGVGTGTINDICRFISFKLKMEYFIVGTAPSMDGFASTATPLIINNIKTTYTTHVAQVIIGDIDVMKNAPMNMISAGVGDILGKYTCLCDWKMANIIKYEYYCETIVQMVRESLKRVAENVGKVKSRDPKVIYNITEALILTGIAMSYVGNSRPASGSEHHLSHFWEMRFLFDGKKAVLHGTKVGIGTVVVLKAYEILRKKTIDFNKSIETISSFDINKWEENIIRTYGPAAQSVIDFERETKKNSIENHKIRIKKIEEHWNEMIDFMNKTLPSSKEVEDMLLSLHAPVSPYEVGVDYETFIDSIVVAKELRDRYGLLQILWDLGIIEDVAVELGKGFKLN